MYRIFLFLCIFEVMAFDSDEAKYIDLLPEAEKQEFLNRIARRILEEIQSQDSPEESHADVTDDQLNAHEAYVQDILKEESDNLRNEKREISEKAKDDINEDPNSNDDRSSKYDYENREKPHIDLTLRDEKTFNPDRRLDQGQNLNDSMDTDNGNSYSVIPVQVVYDENNKQDETTTYRSVSSNESHEQNEKTTLESFDNSKQLNNSKTEETKSNSNEYKPNSSVEDIPRPDQSKDTDETEDLSTPLPNTETETVMDITSTVEAENIQTDDSNFQVSTEQSTIDKEEETTKIEIDNTEGIDDVTTMVPVTYISEENTKFNDSINTESSVKIDRYSKNLNIRSKDIDTEVTDQSNFMPLTTDLSTMSDLDNIQNSEKDESTTTIEGLTKNPIKKHNKGMISGNTENDKLKRYYRKKLKILSEDYTIEEIEPSKDIQGQNGHKNQYFVYEIADDKPTYIQQADSTLYEQPYYIPIYNFAPYNAYYNPHNNLGPNDNEDLEIEIDNNNDVFNEEVFTRNGFEIDLRSKGKKKYKYPSGKIAPSPREHIYRMTPNLGEIGANHNNYFDNDYYFDIEKGRRQDGGFHGEDDRWNIYMQGQQSTASNVKDLPDFTMDRNIEKLVYGSRRRGKKMERRGRKKKKFSVRELPNSSEEDHPYYSIHKSNINDHVRAVKKLLYKQKKFGYMPPTPYAIQTEPRYKRMMGNDGDLIINDKRRLIDIHNNIEKGGFNPTTNNIAWDYYWGRLNKLNFTNDFDDNEDKMVQTRKVKNRNQFTPQGYLPKEISDTRTERDDFKIASIDLSIDALVKVLSDMIRRDNRYLVSYNWLQTTVEINGAIKKLLDLTENAQNGNHIHPLDLELLNYVINLYNSSNDILKNSRLNIKNSNSKLVKNKLNTNVSKTIACLLARMRTLPKTKKKKLGEKIKNPLNLWHAWKKYYNRVLDGDKTPDNNVLSDFKDFLIDLQDNLYELHNALNRIAVITTYKNQNWYQDLKNIFLKLAPRKRLLQVILHLGTSKLVNSIEKRMKREAYVKNNKEDTRRIQDDFVFVLRVLEVMNDEISERFLEECRIE